MLDVEPVIEEELTRLDSASASLSDWTDVLARSKPAPRRRTRLILVAAAGLVALVVAAVAIAAGFGGFGGWLNGEPGKPASPQAQQAVQRATRSWQAFPRSAQLRQLVTATVDGVRYELDGFRGAGSLCLRLVASGKASGSRLGCTPLADLRAAKAPALVLEADSSLGASGTATNGPFTLTRPVAAVTFGVVADGVRQIEIRHLQPSPTRVFVSGDAFLAVSPRLSPFNVTSSIVASAGTTHASVPFVHGSIPFGPASPVVLPKPTGPTTTQRATKGGAIHWFARREPRGSAVPSGLHGIVGTSSRVIFARMIAPDPALPERMVVSIGPAGPRYFNGRLRNNRQVCAALVEGPYTDDGCWPAGRLFGTDPFTFGVEVQRGGQVVTVDGLVDDDVSTLKVFPATGAARTVKTNDNGYLVVATLPDFPLRLVAYDASGLIIGNKILDGPFTTMPYTGPRPARGAKWRKVLTGASGAVYETASTSGGTCLAFKETGSGTGMECGQTVSASGMTLGIGSDRSHSWIEGIVGAKIRTLRVTLRNGRVLTVGPLHRYVFYRIEQSALRDRNYAVRRIDGLDAGGRTILTRRYG